MNVVALTGKDSFLLDGRVFSDFADGDVVTMAFPNGVADAKTGKNGNTIYAQNESGRLSEVTIRLIRGSGDDKYMQNRFAQQQANFPGFVLFQGQFIKLVGDGAGNVARDTYVQSGGITTKQVEAKSNAEGDVSQSVSVWHLKFANAPRIIT